MASIAVGDHLAVDGADHPDGVYRVVGTTDETVTVLRVGDAAGRRIHTGEVVTIDRDTLDGFAPAESPSRRRSFAARLVSLPTTAYWSIRALGSQLRARPLPGVAALVLFVTGAVGGSFLAVPELVLDAMVLLGGLGLAAIGSGRL